MQKPALVLITLMLAGCTAAPEETVPEPPGPVRVSESAVKAIDPWANGLAEAELTRLEASTIEFDVPCANSYGIEAARTTDWLVTNGTARIVVEYSLDGAATGHQGGWSFGDGEITWGPVVATGGTQVLEIPVTADLVEQEAPRWHFWHRKNIPVAEPDCYAGGGDSSWTLIATAYPS